MRIIDITRELLSAECYPGDPEPKLNRLLKLSQGDGCNLSCVGMCLHNGTHVDAPYHFIEGGATAESLPLNKLCGGVKVVASAETLTRAAAQELMMDKPSRLLIKGAIRLTKEAAEVFAELELIGTEGLTVGGEDDTAEVHRILLSQGVAILENLELSEAEPGYYTLFALPLKIAGADGAPVRAVLVEG